jgi:flagellar biosynthesis/type III secretory pathway protein FliH
MGRIAVAGADAEIHPLEAVLAGGPRQTAATAAAALENAARERTRTLEEAHAQGYAEGMARARHEVAQAAAAARAEVQAANAAEEARLQSAAEGMASLVRQLQAQAATMDAELESLAIDAAFAAALRVLATVPDADLVAGVCRAALDEYRQRPAVVRVSIDDAPLVAFLGDAGAGALRIDADPAMATGECRIHTHKAAYGTSLSARLDALKDAFLQVRSAARERGE